MGEAIPFIQISDEGEFTVDIEAMTMLQKYDTKKIACISIAGPYRSGKSFLANRFIGQMKGFEIGSTQKSCTRGIWIWNQPIEINVDTHAFLIDTEGLHSVDRYTDLDSKIFTLSILLSSMFVYNTMGHITSNCIEELNVAVNLAKNLMKLREKEEQNHEETKEIKHTEEEVEELNSLLPSLFWVLRDFSLDLESFTSSEYLNDCLKKVYGKNDPNLKENAIKKHFSQIECHPLVRPTFKEKDVAHVMDLEYESLREEFRAGVDTLMKRVLTRPKLKTIGNKNMTGSMLLGMAIEYTEAINSGTVPTIYNSFERVAHAEAQRFVDNQIEKYKIELKHTISEDSEHPLNEEDIDDIFNKFLKKSIKSLAIKLYDTVSVSAFLEVQKQLEKSLKEDFNEVKNINYQKSLKYNYDYLVKSFKDMKNEKIETVEDINPSFIQTYYEEYYELCNKYDRASIGPAKSEAFCKFINFDFNNAHQELLDDLDLAFKEDINNLQIRVLELQKSEQKWISILNSLKNSITASEDQRQKLYEEKKNLEEKIEELQKVINDSTSEHSKKVEIRLLKLKSDKKLIETKIKEKKETVDDYRKEIDELEVVLQNNKDQKLTLQRDKIKEVSTRKNKLQLMRNEYDQRKQKFKDKSDFIALNSAFKVIKNSLDDVKALLAEQDKSKDIKSKIQELRKKYEEATDYGKSIELSSKVKHMKTLLQEKQKYAEKKRILQEKLEEASKEADEIQEEKAKLDKEARILKTKKKLLIRENKMLTDDTNYLGGSLLINQLDLTKYLDEKDSEEKHNLESLQQRFYGETVKMATLCEDIDNITCFISEFVKEAKESSKKRQSVVRIKAFSELQEEDQENINEMLSNQDIEFK
ncbi:unnamed protein product [Moneuplotes crassus]|uniref:GB1/RHD3-type G domain-containing protein n=2 Tax=Euplotes crassus TaxID=5936 RepID=A0AAD1Y5D7_EUPCR|nr:unnamed protein product [Moneuplotes crassus]